MTAFGDLATRIADDLSRSDLGDPIRREIRSAVKHYETERWNFLEDTIAGATVAGTKAYALPTDYRNIDVVEVTVNSDTYLLQPRDYSYVEWVDAGDYRGQPTVYALYADNIHMYPVPDSSYTYTISYTKTDASLSADSSTNAMLTNAPEVILHRAAAMVRANIMREPQAMADMARMSGTSYLSPLERQAHRSARRRVMGAVSIGRLSGHM